jgi:hypothetical protein
VAASPGEEPEEKQGLGEKMIDLLGRLERFIYYS